ncbi:MAG: endonuclease domain-containing protein [Gammaproteobacteria bacterium]|nr:endonuclease domain-containing protein [Gammaproteobacteria bacterium]MBU1723458.1 endonuclease domain-containing protein [Gammaproteobacteria bacterium]MBU2004420.1 endonuclease domain-containing protein [Gammaproteobacteria bacterium]
MRPYNPNLRAPARDLRTNQIPAEQLLWTKLRRKQIAGVPFYRQKPIGNFIADFYCAAAKLIIELDGKHHAETNRPAHDQERTQRLEALGLQVIRFTNQQIYQDIESVIIQITSQTIARLQTVNAEHKSE